MSWIRFFVVLTVFLFAGAVRTVAVAAEPIVVGMSGAFSGPIKALGIEVYRGAAAYFAHVNEAGGVHGRSIVFKAYDDTYDPALTLANTIRLVEQDKANLLFSYVGTPTVTRILPLLQVYENQALQLFFPVSGADPHRRAPYDRYVYNLRASYSQEVAALVRGFARAGKRRFAILFQVDSYGRSGWEGLRNALHEESLTIVGEATYRRGFGVGQSMQEQVDILGRSNPDVIICIATYAAAAAFIRDARNSGLDVPVTNVSFVASEAMLELLQAEGRLQGRDYTRNLINSQVVPSYEDLSLPGVLEYRRIMDQYPEASPPQRVPEAYTPLPYSFASFEGFLNAKALVHMLRNVPVDQKSEGTFGKPGDFTHFIDLGIGEPFFLGPNQRQGLHTVYFTTIKDGQFVPISDWNAWRRP